MEVETADVATSQRGITNLHPALLLGNDPSIE